MVRCLVRFYFSNVCTVGSRCSVVFAILAAGFSVPDAYAQQTEPDHAWSDWFSGELQLGLDLGRSARDGDIELDQVLRLKVDPPEHEKFHLRATLWTLEDLDGHESRSSIFRTLNDARDTSVQTRVMSLYLQIDDLGGDSALRLGRQRITEGIVYNRLDGLFYKWRNPIWSWYGFTGARASVYTNARKDLRSGGGISVRLPTKTRVAADLFYGDDDRKRFNTGATFTTISSVSVTQLFTNTHSAYGRATWNGNHFDELRFTAQGFFPGSEIVYSASYQKRFSAVAERVNEVNEFFHLLGEFNEFQDYSVRVDIPITKHFGLGAEAQVHDAENGNNSSFNRDFQRYGVSFDFFDIAGHYDTSLILDYWDADDGEGQWTVTGEVSREWEHTKAAVGVDYDRFEDRVTNFDPVLQDVFVVDTHEDIYSVYVRLKHDFNDNQTLRARAIFEDDDGPDSPYWYLRAEYTLRF